MMDNEQLPPADAGRLETPVRPRAWWRESTLPECRPCVTTDPEEAQQWRDDGLAVVELGDVDAERERWKKTTTWFWSAPMPDDVARWLSENPPNVVLGA